jgi:cofilin
MTGQKVQKLRYIIFKVSDDTTKIVIETDSSEHQDEDPTYDNFLNKLDITPPQPRWAVYDFEYTTEDGGLRKKICFYAW